VVFLATTHPAHLPELLQHVPRGQNLLFKLNDPRHHTIVQTFFSLERVTAFVSYTAPAGKIRSAADVTISAAPDDRCLQMYADLGRSGLGRKVVEGALNHLEHGGFLTRYQAQEDNRASTRLAESIGLRHVVTYEHWRHVPH